jgi:lysyl-tRNA synthetase class 2
VHPDRDRAHFRQDGERRLELLRGRARAARGVRDFFDARGFLEVETPLMVPSPGLEVHLDAFEVRGAGEPRWLITSPEYHMKRLLAGGASRIYQLAKCFRRGEAGHLHQPEFTMLEWYRAPGGSADVMADTEQLVAELARAASGGSAELSGVHAPCDVTPPWPRRTVAELFERLAGLEVQEVLPDEERFFRIWIERIEPHLGRGRPVFVTGWPAPMASLARLDPEDPSIADRFEAYVDGVELCNGFGELVDPDEQRRRLQNDQNRRQQLGKPVYPLDERFVQALEDGIPPSGGNALGFDRLVMLLLGARDIRDVVAFDVERL